MPRPFFDRGRPSGTPLIGAAPDPDLRGRPDGLAGIGLYDPVHGRPGRRHDHDTAQSRVVVGADGLGHVPPLLVEVERKPAVRVVAGVDREGPPVSRENYFGQTGPYDLMEEKIDCAFDQLANSPQQVW